MGGRWCLARLGRVSAGGYVALCGEMRGARRASVWCGRGEGVPDELDGDFPELGMDMGHGLSTIFAFLSSSA
jgi:hypothetical protein